MVTREGRFKWTVTFSKITSFSDLEDVVDKVCAKIPMYFECLSISKEKSVKVTFLMYTGDSLALTFSKNPTLSPPLVFVIVKFVIEKQFPSKSNGFMS